MRIAVISETSSADKNKFIIEALSAYKHEIINIGMKEKGEPYELQYTHTGFLSALFINTSLADLVVGGCGTGQGYILSAMQYPNVFCGHILSPLDAFLFTQINAGNCISLALNQGYGWASDVNIKMIFEAYFNSPFGEGYPPERKEPQNISRMALKNISGKTHKTFSEIVKSLDEGFVRHALNYPSVKEWIENIKDENLKNILKDFN